MVGLAMSVLDTAIVNVALPVIAKDLHADAADAIWVVNAYQLAVLVSLLPFASLGDIFGYRRVYRFGLVLYTAATLISATAGSLDMLILGRGLQGLGAAGLMSVNTALVRYTYPRRQLGRAIGMVSLVVSVSAASGPSIAGAILAVAPWPFLFAVNVPIGVVTFILAMRLLPSTKPSEHRFDVWSAVLCALMFMCLIGGITGVGHGQSALPLAGEFAGALATGYLLVRRQLNQPMPLLPVDLFRRPIFALSVTTSVCSFIAQGIAFVSLPFYFHDVLGASAVTTGLMMTPWAVMTAIMAPIAGTLADRYPAGILGGIGLSILAGGFVLLALLPADPAIAGRAVARRGLRARVRLLPVAEQPRDRDQRPARAQRRRRRDPGHVAAARAVDRRGAGRAGLRRFRRHARRHRRNPGGGRFRRRRRVGEPQPAVECRTPPADVRRSAHVARRDRGARTR